MSALVTDPIVRRGAAVVAAIVALILLMSFHSVVAGAVQRAAHRKVEAELSAMPLSPIRPSDPGYFSARKVSLADRD